MATQTKDLAQRLVYNKIIRQTRCLADEDSDSPMQEPYTVTYDEVARAILCGVRRPGQSDAQQLAVVRNVLKNSVNSMADLLGEDMARYVVHDLFDELTDAKAGEVVNPEKHVLAEQEDNAYWLQTAKRAECDNSYHSYASSKGCEDIWAMIAARSDATARDLLDHKIADAKRKRDSLASEPAIDVEEIRRNAREAAAAYLKAEQSQPVIRARELIARTSGEAKHPGPHPWLAFLFAGQSSPPAGPPASGPCCDLAEARKRATDDDEDPYHGPEHRETCPTRAKQDRDSREAIASTSGEAKHPGPPKGGAKAPKGLKNPPKAEAAVIKPQKPPRAPRAAQPMERAAQSSEATSRGSAKKPTEAWEQIHAGIKQQHGPAEGAMRRRADGESIIYVGVERVATISGIPGVSHMEAGQSLIVDHPSGISVIPGGLGVRLPIEAEPFGNYEFLGLEVMYQPAANAFNAPKGSFLLAYKRDPDSAEPEPSVSGVNAIASWDCTVRGRLNDYTELHCPVQDKDQAVLFTQSSEDGRFSIQGKIYMVAEGTISTDGFEEGTLYVRYRCRLSKPDLPQAQEPTLFLVNPTAASAAAGHNLSDGFSYFGSTAIATTLAVSTSSGPQLMLQPTNELTNWEIMVEWHATTAAATLTTAVELHVDPTVPGQTIPSWPTYTTWGTLSTNPLYLNTQVQSSTNGFNIFTNEATALGTANNAIGISIWRFSSSAPVLIEFVAPGLSAGTSLFRATIKQCATLDVARAKAHAAFLTLEQQLAIERVNAGAVAALPQLRKAIGDYVTQVDAKTVAVSTLDLQYLGAFHSAIGTPLPTAANPVAAPMFLPLLAGAAAWLLGKFGPTIAEHVLGYGARKLEAYAAGKNEEPDARERRRIRKDRKAERDSDPEV